MFYRPSNRKLGLHLTAVLLQVLFAPVALSGQVIAILTDGPGARPSVPEPTLISEVLSLTAGEFDVSFPADKQLNGNWSAAGAGAALDALLADPDVDLVLCLGVLSSQEAARRETLNKPVIATIAADPVLQGYPFDMGTSGRRNFVYITNVRNIDDDLRLFRQAVRFTHVAVMIDKDVLAGFGDFSRQKAAQLSASLGVQITPVPVGDSLPAAVAAMPHDVDAVFVTPLLRYGDEGVKRLATALVQRKLPSFSSYGVSELYDGLLMATGGRPEDEVRLVRRIATVSCRRCCSSLFHPFATLSHVLRKSFAKILSKQHQHKKHENQK